MLSINMFRKLYKHNFEEICVFCDFNIYAYPILCNISVAILFRVVESKNVFAITVPENNTISD